MGFPWPFRNVVIDSTNLSQFVSALLESSSVFHRGINIKFIHVHEDNFVNLVFSIAILDICKYMYQSKLIGNNILTFSTQFMCSS